MRGVGRSAVNAVDVRGKVVRRKWKGCIVDYGELSARGLQALEGFVRDRRRACEGEPMRTSGDKGGTYLEESAQWETGRVALRRDARQMGSSNACTQ